MLLVAGDSYGSTCTGGIISRVLEPGSYLIGVMRFRRNRASDGQRVSYTLTLVRGLSPELHAIEDATCLNEFLRPGRDLDGAFVVNRVRSTQYPARLVSIVAFVRLNPPPIRRSVRIIAFADPLGGGTPPLNSPLIVDQTVMTDSAGVATVSLGVGGPLIQSGDFYVGYVVDLSNGTFPEIGRVLFSGMRSFISRDGGQTYQTADFRDRNGRPVNVQVRASVNTVP
jgi:hypothetical protein